jgi:hypothetical protein
MTFGHLGAIETKVQAIIRSTVTEADELKAARLARKVSRTEQEQAFIDNVDAVIAAAITEGRAATADMALLSSTMAYEQAVKRLQQYKLSVGKPAEPEVPAVEPLPATVSVTAMDGTVSTVPNPLVVKDETARSEAEAVIANASEAVLALAAQRT